MEDPATIRSQSIWQCATVVRARDGRRWLQFDQPSSCSRCADGSGCGAALLGRLFGRPASRLPLPESVQRPDNARVRVGISGRWLLLAAAAAYLAPVVAFVAGTLVANWHRPGHDALALACGLAALAVAIAALWRFAGRLLYPRLLIGEPAAALETAAPRNHLDDV